MAECGLTTKSNLVVSSVDAAGDYIMEYRTGERTFAILVSSSSNNNINNSEMEAALRQMRE